jgi:predicted amidohydrolase
MLRTAFNVGIAQVSPRLGDVTHNVAVYEDGIREARRRGLDLIVFPELSLTGYLLRDLVSAVALRRDAAEVSRLAELSRDIAVVAGIVEEADDCRFYNAALYFEGGALKHVHRKVYLPTYGMFEEQRYFARGNQVRAFDTRFGRIAMLICEDLWHPSTAYLAALDGATVIICPSTSPLRGVSEESPADENARYWELLNSFYAQTFSLFLVYANRVGFEDGIGFWGGSEIVDPFGRRLAKGRYYEADFICAEISQRAARRSRVTAPLLRDEDLDLTINELLRLRGRPTQLTAAGEAPAGGAVHALAARRRGAVAKPSAAVGRPRKGAPRSRLKRR